MHAVAIFDHPCFLHMSIFGKCRFLRFRATPCDFERLHSYYLVQRIPHCLCVRRFGAHFAAVEHDKLDEQGVCPE